MVRSLPPHCGRGHLFDAENTYLRANGQRQCRACARENGRARYEAQFRTPWPKGGRAHPLRARKAHP